MLHPSAEVHNPRPSGVKSSLYRCEVHVEVPGCLQSLVMSSDSRCQGHMVADQVKLKTGQPNYLQCPSNGYSGTIQKTSLCLTPQEIMHKEVSWP